MRSPVGRPRGLGCAGRPLEALRVALLTTAEVHYRDAEAFEAADGSRTFRPIMGRRTRRGLEMSHSCVNFDKSGFAEDVNLVFPLDRRDGA